MTLVTFRFLTDEETHDGWHLATVAHELMVCLQESCHAMKQPRDITMDIMTHADMGFEIHQVAGRTQVIEGIIKMMDPLDHHRPDQVVRPQPHEVVRTLAMQ